MCLLRTKYLEHIISSNVLLDKSSKVILLSMFGNPFACPSTMFRNIIFECPCFIRRMRSWSLCLLLSTYSLCGFLFPVGYFLLCNPSTAQDVHYCLLPKQLNVFKIMAVCPLSLLYFCNVSQIYIFMRLFSQQGSVFKVSTVFQCLLECVLFRDSFKGNIIKIYTA